MKDTPSKGETTAAYRSPPAGSTSLTVTLIWTLATFSWNFLPPLCNLIVGRGEENKPPADMKRHLTPFIVALFCRYGNV